MPHENLAALKIVEGNFDEAIEAVRAGGVFTTHTPVPAGNDVFPQELVRRYMKHYAGELGLSVDDVRLGSGTLAVAFGAERDLLHRQQQLRDSRDRLKGRRYRRKTRHR